MNLNDVLIDCKFVRIIVLVLKSNPKQGFDVDDSTVLRPCIWIRYSGWY